MSKLIGLDTTLSYDTDGSGAYTDLAYIVDGFSSNATAQDVDTTVLADNWMTFAQGQKDGGELTLSLAYDSTDSAQQAINGWLDDGTILYWRITYPNSDTEDFQGYIKAVGRSVNKAEMITSEVVIKVTGDAGLAQS